MKVTIYTSQSMLIHANYVCYLRSPSRQHYCGVGRSSSQTSRHYRTEGRTESPVGPQTVWLSKKMKELTETQTETPRTATTHTDPVSASSRARIYERNISTSTYASSLTDQERTERTTRTFLDDLGSSMKNGGNLSPTDSFIDRMIISAGRDLSSPLDVPLPPMSRNSSIKQSPFTEYQSLPHRSIENELRNLESKYLESRKDSPLKDYKAGRENLEPNIKVGYLESSPVKSYFPSGKTVTSVTSRDRANSFHNIRAENQARSETAKPRARHSTLPYGVAMQDVRAAKFDQDMSSILKELESTGFFTQVGQYEFLNFEHFYIYLLSGWYIYYTSEKKVEARLDKMFYNLLIFYFSQSRSVNSGYFPACPSSNITPPPVLSSNPLSLPLVSAENCRPGSCASFVSNPHTLNTLNTLNTPHNSVHSACVPHQTTKQESMVVLRKEDLEKLFREQIESVRFCCSVEPEPVCR